MSDTDYNKLVENYQTSANFRVRNRSHAILLSFQKYSIDKIADICGVHRTAVSRWIDWWNAPRIGRLKRFTKKGANTDIND